MGRFIAGLLFVLSVLAFLAWFGIRVYNEIVFEIECTGHLKRAADANTVELAAKEMETAVSYLEKREITNGYTSILYRTPDEDVGFWYANLKSSWNELKNVSPGATQLEKSNVLMKLRETILDAGSEGKTKITAPNGIEIFPHNMLFFWWAMVSLLFIVIGRAMFFLLS